MTERRPDERFGVRVGTWDLGSLSVKWGEECEELRKRKIDVCCLQVRWRGYGCQDVGDERKGI